MAQRKKILVSDVEPLIDECDGNIAEIARRLGVGRATVQRRIDESVTLQDNLESARETMLDTAESKLYEAVKAGETTELIFFLKTQGKKRGYTERTEITGAGGEALEIKYVNDWRTMNDADH